MMRSLCCSKGRRGGKLVTVEGQRKGEESKREKEDEPKPT
jgi:hypothetical protein